MKKRVLIAPLDWGLGHATRCIPLINKLLAQGATVIIATNGRAYDLLKGEFPGLTIEKLPAYGIRYWFHNMLLNIAIQLPNIIWAFVAEYFQTQKLLRRHQIDLIISDNRFGCFSKKAKSIFVTHQINILIPNLILHRVANFLNKGTISQFDACWIPDFPPPGSLTGALSGNQLPCVRYIGILSRFVALNLPIEYDAIAVLSGPEPQRTYLENKLLAQMKGLPYHFLLVQGKSEQSQQPRQLGNITLITHLRSLELQRAIAASGFVICRSGYSSIMDLAAMGKRALLIPTPGQTEQAYLAARLSADGICLQQNQSTLNLPLAFQQISLYSGFDPKKLNAEILLEEAMMSLEK